MGNGDHLINLQWDPIETDQMSLFELKFAIYNSGHANEEAFRKRVDDALTAAAGAAAPLSGYASAFIVVARALIDLFDFDCDGLVAGDLMRASGAELAQQTINWPHIFHITRGYPGTDSAVGCGTNPRYSASWYVQRLNPAEPRLDLLVLMQGRGETGSILDGAFCGTRGQSLPLEGMTVSVRPMPTTGPS